MPSPSIPRPYRGGQPSEQDRIVKRARALVTTNDVSYGVHFGYKTQSGEKLWMADGTCWFHPYSGGAPFKVKP